MATFGSSRKRRGSCMKRDGCCSMCGRKDKTVEAHGHCDKCSVSLCGECYRGHWKSRLRNAHVVVKGEQSVAERPAKSKRTKHSTKVVRLPNANKTKPTNTGAAPVSTSCTEYIKYKRGLSIEAKHLVDINLDRKDVSGTGCQVLKGGRLVIADSSKNHKLMMVDTENNKIMSEETLGNFPWDLTAINNSTIAVTIVIEKKISIVTISRNNTLKKTRDIPVSGHCRGIDINTDGKLVVCFSLPVSKLEVISLQGEVLTSVDLIVPGRRFEAHHVTLSSDGQFVYIVDTAEGSLTKWSKDGVPQSKFSSQNIACLRNLCIGPDGYIFLCDSINKKLLLISPDCKTAAEAISNVGPGGNIESVAWCSDSNKLYLVSWDSVVHVYQLVN